MFKYAIFGEKKLILSTVSRLINRKKEYISAPNDNYILFNDAEILFTFSKKYDLNNKLYKIKKLSECSEPDENALYKYIVFQHLDNGVTHKRKDITLFKELPENVSKDMVYCFEKYVFKSIAEPEGTKYKIIFLNNHAEIMKYLDILNDTDRKIIEMKYIKNKEFKEIAKIMNTKITNLVQKHRLILKKLVTHWEKMKLFN